MRRAGLFGLLALLGTGAIALVYFGRAPSGYGWVDEGGACIARIDVARGAQRIALVHSGKVWVAASIGGLPARPQSVAALRQAIAGVRAADVAADAPVEVGIVRCNGKPSRFRSRAGALLSQSLKPSAWVAARPPRIDAGDVRVFQIADDGEVVRFERQRNAWETTSPAPLGLPAAWIRAFNAIRPDSVAPGDSFNWAGARYLLLQLEDGVGIEAQVLGGSVPARIRFTAHAENGADASARARVRAVRGLSGVAFEVAPPR